MADSTGISARDENAQEPWRGRLTILAISLFVLAVLLFAYIFIAFRAVLGLVGAIFVSVGVFPLTYVAYLAFRAPAQRDRLKDDFRLLGLAGTGDLDDVVEKLYNTAYSTTHFAVFISLIVTFCLLIGAAFAFDTRYVGIQGLPWVGTADNAQPQAAQSVPDTASQPAAEAPSAVPQSTASESSVAQPAPALQSPQQTTFWMAMLGTAWATIQDSYAAASQAADRNTPPDPRSQLVYFAFFGAYLFGLQELVRRYNTFDLLPQVYSSIFVRLVLATGVVYVGATLISTVFGNDANQAPLALALAFLIGIFPQRGIDWLQDRVKDTFDSRMSFSSVRPLTEIVGISPWHQSRLAQMGIDDAQNLAMADMRKLLLTTQFDTQEIVNWIDQAILYVKVGQKMVSLRENYINTFYELRTALEASTGASSAVATLLNLSPTDAATLNRIIDTNNYPNYTHILEYYLRTSDVAQQRAEEGAEVIFGRRTPYLAADVQGEEEDTTEDEKELTKRIAKLAKLAGDYKGDAKHWASLGVYKQMLSRRHFAALRQLNAALASNGAGKDDAAKQAAALAALEQEVVSLQGEARAAFDCAIKLDPGCAELYVRRADFLLCRRLFLHAGDDADISLQDGIPLQDIELALQDCTNALQHDRAFAMAYNYRARAYEKQGNITQALADFNYAIQTNDCLAVAYKNRGTFFTSQGSFDQAVADFQKAYYCGYHKPVLFASWGKALLGLEQYEAAVEKLSYAIALDPNLAQAYADRGYAYYELDNLGRARGDCLRASEKDRTLVSPYINLGLVEHKRGRYDEAIKYYDQALQVDDGTRKDTIYLYRGQANQALGNKQGAVADLQMALDHAVTEAARNRVRLPLAVAQAHIGAVDAAKTLLADLLRSPIVTDDQRRQADDIYKRLG